MLYLGGMVCILYCVAGQWGSNAVKDGNQTRLQRAAQGRDARCKKCGKSRRNELARLLHFIHSNEFATSAKFTTLERVLSYWPHLSLVHFGFAPIKKVADKADFV